MNFSGWNIDYPRGAGNIWVYPDIVVYQHTLALKFRVYVVTFLNVCWENLFMMRRIEVFRKVICKWKRSVTFTDQSRSKQAKT